MCSQANTTMWMATRITAELHSEFKSRLLTSDDVNKVRVSKTMSALSQIAEASVCVAAEAVIPLMGVDLNRQFVTDVSRQDILLELVQRRNKASVFNKVQLGMWKMLPWKIC